MTQEQREQILKEVQVEYIKEQLKNSIDRVNEYNTKKETMMEKIKTFFEENRMKMLLITFYSLVSIALVLCIIEAIGIILM